MDTNENQGEKTIDELVEKSSKELIRIKSVFPFALFPTEVVVDELKVTIITRWFLSSHHFPVLLKDIKIVSVVQGIIFGSLTFEIAGHEANPSVIDNLRKKDAIRAHQIIVGLTTVTKEKADKSIAGESQTNLIDKLTEIGGTSDEPKIKKTK